ncbi:Uu.00g094830.m01.CDS01 [Anthostomella pinea]|uniref:Uu.00g094830.m01.CDS01 n=1 Tax=Anthostomella pinea TaxID=933095 RepID=A0AAI8YKQ5_9PEZI|nr:Uu.00g094830.m01.CDS01 [Anthostomella pinea]
MLAFRQPLAQHLPDATLCAISLESSGLLRNFENIPSLQPAIIAIAALMVPFVITITAGRLYVNRHSFKLADYFVAVGLILDLVFTGVLLAGLVSGPALFFPKAAIFLFYLQLFSVNKSVRIGSKIGLVMAFLAYFPPSLVLCYFNAPHMGQSWDDLLISGMPEKGLPVGDTVGVAGVVASVISLAYRIKLLGLGDSAGGVAIAIIVENNVAIIVGSLPAFANFLRLHVSETAFYKSLRSRLGSGSKGQISDFKQKDSWQKRTLRTFGSPQKHHPRYHELSDSVIHMSQVTVPEEAFVPRRESDQGIYRTVGFSQEEHTRQSWERLV